MGDRGPKRFSSKVRERVCRERAIGTKKYGEAPSMGTCRGSDDELKESSGKIEMVESGSRLGHPTRVLYGFLRLSKISRILGIAGQARGPANDLTRPRRESSSETTFWISGLEVLMAAAGAPMRSQGALPGS